MPGDKFASLWMRGWWCSKPLLFITDFQIHLYFEHFITGASTVPDIFNFFL